MEQYDFAKMTFKRGKEVTFSCTDGSKIVQLVKELKTIHVKMTILYDDKFHTNETFRVTLKGFENKEEIAGWWIIRQLCKQGWQPMGETIIAYDEVYPHLSYSFQKKTIT